MAFFDDVVITVRGGDGGSGCVSFAHRRFQPKAGPDGGNGGEGGSVYLRATRELNSLEPYRYKKDFRAQDGTHGQGNDRDGRRGRDLILDVPLGTVVVDLGTGMLLKELLTDGETLLVAKGGAGGKGNKFFRSPTNRAPRFAGKGKQGEEKRLRLTLKTIADVGLVGLPNAGKSTLLSQLTNARPKVADFPFTTLSPHVGVLPSKGERSILIADIPGLVEGASQGRGLGHLFLRHIERTRLLLILLSLDYFPGGSPLEDLDILLEELKAYNPELVLRPRIIAINKIDLGEKASRDLKELLTSLQGRGEKAIAVSALTGENLQSLVLMLEEIFSEDVCGTKGNIGAA